MTGYHLKPLEQLAEEVRLLRTRKAEYTPIEVDDLGPNRTSFTMLEYDEEYDNLEFRVYVEIPLPHRLVDLDPEGIRGILEEYWRGLIAIKEVLGKITDYERGELRDQAGFSTDMVTAEAIVEEPGEAVEYAIRVRRAIGLRDPQTLMGLRDPHRTIYLEAVNKLLADLASTAREAKPQPIGWTSREELYEAAAGKLPVDPRSYEEAIRHLVDKGYLEETPAGVRARIGTGAFAEALYWADPLHACLAWPYALNTTHRHWAITYKGDEECIKLRANLIELEEKHGLQHTLASHKQV